uniref:Uncharacterized protein n=1 Tax=Labrus bergylta TaxID=56723 RepID=A0A3Q3FKY9_9LABR
MNLKYNLFFHIHVSVPLVPQPFLPFSTTSNFIKRFSSSSSSSPLLYPLPFYISPTSYLPIYKFARYLFPLPCRSSRAGFRDTGLPPTLLPSITYAVIGSAVIFVLVVALLALVLHHQRKRSVLLPRGVRGSSHHHHHHQPLLLSRLVILDRGHVHAGSPRLSHDSPSTAGQYSSTSQALQLLSGTLYPSGLPSMDSPPSYSQAVLDVSRPPWFDLPPPPYLPDGELPSEGELPQYEDPPEPLSHPAAHPSAPSTTRTVASGAQQSASPREESDQL